jgi:hypothetical protein
MIGEVPNRFPLIFCDFIPIFFDAKKVRPKAPLDQRRRSNRYGRRQRQTQERRHGTSGIMIDPGLDCDLAILTTINLRDHPR